MSSRIRMSWDWVGDYPIFFYTRFIDHFRFEVSIVKGEINNQNAEGYGPRAEPWIKYNIFGFKSKDEVVADAMLVAWRKLRDEGYFCEKPLTMEDFLT